MKWLILFLIIAFSVACTQQKITSTQHTDDTVGIVVNGDSLLVDNTTAKAFTIVHAKYDSVIHRADSFAIAYQHLAAANDTLKHFNDSLRTALFRANYKLIRTQYYVNICIKRPVNDKYLKGWIRALFQ
jgi:hypothetical protein